MSQNWKIIKYWSLAGAKGTGQVEVSRDVGAEATLNLAVKTVRRDSIVYRDRFRSYEALMFCGYRHLRIDHRKRFSRGKVYINGLEGFWSFAKEWIIKDHVASARAFPFLTDIGHLLNRFVKWFISPPSRIKSSINGGMGFAFRDFPRVRSRMTPVSIFTSILFSSSIWSGASTDSRMGRPMLKAFRYCLLFGTWLPWICPPGKMTQ